MAPGADAPNHELVSGGMKADGVRLQPHLAGAGNRQVGLSQPLYLGSRARVPSWLLQLRNERTGPPLDRAPQDSRFLVPMVVVCCQAAESVIRTAGQRCRPSANRSVAHPGVLCAVAATLPCCCRRHEAAGGCRLAQASGSRRLVLCNAGCLCAVREWGLETFWNRQRNASERLDRGDAIGVTQLEGCRA